jgi:hypothetical protein
MAGHLVLIAGKAAGNDLELFLPGIHGPIAGARFEVR